MGAIRAEGALELADARGGARVRRVQVEYGYVLKVIIFKPIIIHEAPKGGAEEKGRPPRGVGTLAPFSRRHVVAAKPMPPVPPVTIATEPFTSICAARGGSGNAHYATTRCSILSVSLPDEY